MLRRVATSLCRGHVDELVTGLSVLLTASTEQAADRPEAAGIERLTSAGTENSSILILFIGTKEQTDLLCDAYSVY